MLNNTLMMNRFTDLVRTAALVSVLALAGIARAQADTLTLDRAVIDAVSTATYEVVVLKPVKDPLSYEHPVPLDLIPYAIRKDPYYSIGTAFAIGPNRLVSAAHVLNIGHASQLKTIRVRDAHGEVRDIDQILKYSLRRDFVVFSLKDKMSSAVLATDTSLRANDKVYAVGDALGQGIVFRDGLYTSDTPEEQDGAWKWMRFSAAASPGNSGGPLIDAEGRVVGVVLGKSENENLNYALPIAEVLKAPDNLAEVDTKMVYTIDNMDMTYGDRLHEEIGLPKPYAELDAEVTRVLDDYGAKLKDKLFARYRDSIFPNGGGSLQLLNSSYEAVVPGIVSKSDDGTWDAFFPSKTNTGDLGDNGFVTYGSVGNSLIVRLQKPDGVPLEKLYRDSTLQMDLMLRGIGIYRSIGPEKTKITSLGKARQEEAFTDSYQRRWIVRTWNLPYSDQQIVLLALPVPGGIVGMLRMAQTERVAGDLVDLKGLADFFYLSYYGTLEQWREFLKMRDLLPPVFGTIAIDFDYGKRFSYASKRIAFSYGPGQMHVTARSDLELRFAYFRENGKVVWDVSQVVAGDDKDNSIFFSVNRMAHPPRQLDDKFRSTWEDITRRRHPYNNSAYFDDKRTVIGDVCTTNLKVKALGAAPLLYTTFFGADGNIGQHDAETRLAGFVKNLRVKEY